VILRCSECRAAAPPDALFCAACGGLLAFEFDTFATDAQTLRATLRERRTSHAHADRRGVWRYRELLPALDRAVSSLLGDLAARGMLAQPDGRVMEGLTSVKVPTLVLVGARDKAFLPAADYVTAKIPGAVKVVVPDAGHVSNVDQPGLFNQAVLEFLGRLG